MRPTLFTVWGEYFAGMRYFVSVTVKGINIACTFNDLFGYAIGLTVFSTSLQLPEVTL